MAERNVHGRCLLVLPAGQDAPLDLIDGLQRRDVSVREVHDAPAAMAAIARTSSRPNMMVLVEPNAMREAEHLVRTVRRYFPRLPVWRYARGGQPPLTPWAENGPPPEPVQAGQSEDETPAPLTPQVEPTETLLTEEELAMLLGDDDDLEPEKDGTL